MLSRHDQNCDGNGNKCEYANICMLYYESSKFTIRTTTMKKHAAVNFEILQRDKIQTITNIDKVLKW